MRKRPDNPNLLMEAAHLKPFYDAAPAALWMGAGLRLAMRGMLQRA